MLGGEKKEIRREEEGEGERERERAREKERERDKKRDVVISVGEIAPKGTVD